MIRFLRSWGLLCLLAAVPLLASCDDEVTAEGIVYFELLDHEFTAVREFTCYDPRSPVTYVEELTCAGDGQTARLLLQEYQGKPRADITDPQELIEFDRLQANMFAGGGLRILHQRDFRIHDLDEAYANYRFFRDGMVAQNVGGGPRANDLSITYWVIPFVQDRPFYRVTVSLESGRIGFPLAYEEYMNTVSGSVLVSEMRVLSLAFGVADPIPVAASPVRSRRTTTLSDAAGAAAYPVFFPMALPVGFKLHLVEEVVLSTDATSDRSVQDVRMIRILLTDGIDVLELIQHASSFNGLLNGLLSSGSGIGGSAPGKNDQLVVPVVRFGSITIASAMTRDHQVTVESKLASERFDNVLNGLRRLN